MKNVTTCLKCSTYLVPFVLSCLKCLVPYVLSCLACLVSYVLSSLTCARVPQSQIYINVNKASSVTINL